MRRNAHVFFAALFTLIVFSGMAQQLPKGIQTVFSPADWPSLLQDLKAARINHKPYLLSKRTRICDHELKILTPFAVAAETVQALDSTKEVTFDDVIGRLNPDFLTIELTSSSISKTRSEGILLALEVDGNLIQPIKDQLISTIFKGVGFYARPTYFATKTFTFDMNAVRSAKSISVVIMEDDKRRFDIPLDLDKLR
jgi:hypothetical protein